MIWIFKTKDNKFLLIGAKTEDEALNIIKATGKEYIYGELHTELKLIKGCSELLIDKL